MTPKSDLKIFQNFFGIFGIIPKFVLLNPTQ